MGFCCGASMVGAVGALRQGSTLIHNVPLFYCPVCHQVEVHPTVHEEFDLVMDYARGEGSKEIILKHVIDEEMIREWKETCTSFQHGDQEGILREQIDMSLDLLGVAKMIGDKEWQKTLFNRLYVLGSELAQYQRT